MFFWIKERIGWVSGLLILIGICTFLLYSWIDVLVSLDYARQQNKYQKREIKLHKSLLLETGKRMSRSEIKRVVTQCFGKDHIIKENGPDELSVDNIVLKFSGDSLVEVKSLGE